MSKIIGIDLGTGNSCVAVMEGGEPVVIENAEGHRTTPSVVSVSNNERKVGEPAKRQMVTNVDNTVYSAKRLIGRTYSEIEKEIDRYPFKITRGVNDKIMITLGGKLMEVQEISAMVLQKMKATAEAHLGEPVTEAVITVPAYFNDTQRQATKDAGEIAGLTVRRIINEPTAAALAYGVDKSGKDKTIAVMDLGCGTYDVSILEISADGVFEVRSTNGDTQLGGDDFDNVIIDWLAQEFMAEFPGEDLRKNQMALQRLKEASEKAKIELSASSETEINLPYILPVNGVPQHLIRTLSRSKFEQLSDSLISRIDGPAKQALKAANMTINDIDEVLLVGGTTRIPAVQKRIKDIFQKEPLKGVNPDEVVAKGAAIQGAVLTGEFNDVLLLDVIPLSLGIETLGGVTTRLIDANTTIPTRKCEVFSTAVDNQSSVEIHILQGERPMANQNKSLGRFILDGILPAAKGVPQIEVTLDIDANGILTVTAIDKATNKENHIRIEGNGGLTDDEIARMKADAEANAEADKKQRDNINTKNSAEQFLNNREKMIDQVKEKLTEEDMSNINFAYDELQSAYDSNNYELMTANINNLQSAWQSVSSKLYQSDSTQSNEPENIDVE